MSEFFLNKLPHKKELKAWLMQLEEKYAIVLRNMLQNKGNEKNEAIIRMGCVYAEIEKNLNKKIDDFYESKKRKDNQEEKINRLKSYLYSENPKTKFQYAFVYGELTPIYRCISNPDSDKGAYESLCRVIANRQIGVLKIIRRYASTLNKKTEDIKKTLQCKDISLHRIELEETTNSITTTSLLKQFEQAKDKNELADMLSDLRLIIDEYSHG